MPLRFWRLSLTGKQQNGWARSTREETKKKKNKQRVKVQRVVEGTVSFLEVYSRCL